MNTSCYDYIINVLHGTPCDVSYCNEIMPQISQYCHSSNWPPGEPIIIYNPDGNICYCCCSCFAFNTPIQISEQSYKLIQNFEKGDEVLTAGIQSEQDDIALSWNKRRVTFSGGVSPNNLSKFMVYVRYGDSSNSEYSDMIVTEDHLFLNPMGKLIPASALQENDVLVDPNGSMVRVRMAVSGSYLGGVNHISTGEYIPGELDGHLLNSNNVVTADFSVQSAFLLGQLDENILVDDLKKRPKVGTIAHRKTNNGLDTIAFVNNPNAWPKGFKVTADTPLINVPVHANRFITAVQTDAIIEANPNNESPPSNAVLETINYVFKQYKNFYPDPVYIYDWNNTLPNAYAWWEQSQQMVVINGGLMRQTTIGQEGLALVVGHLLSALDQTDTDNKALVCKGVADYNGTGDFFGNVFRDSVYIDTFKKGIAQLTEFFHLIPEKDRAGNPNDKCSDPSIDCRIDAFWAVIKLENLPTCADPNARNFELNGATEDNNIITLTFNEKLNKATAETVSNYFLSGDITITDAKLNLGNSKRVELIANLSKDTEYEVTVEDVISEFGDQLALGYNRAVFRTN